MQRIKTKINNATPTTTHSSGSLYPNKNYQRQTIEPEQFNVTLTHRIYETPVHRYADRLDSLLSGIMTEEEMEEAMELLEKIKDAAEDLDEDDEDYEYIGINNGKESGNDHSTITSTSLNWTSIK